MKWYWHIDAVVALATFLCGFWCARHDLWALACFFMFFCGLFTGQWETLRGIFGGE